MTKTTLRKALSLLLAVAMLCILCACGEKSDKENDNDRHTDDDSDTPTYTSALTKEALSYIEAGNYEAAYMLLKDVEDINANKNAIALRDKLVWVPVEWEWKDWICYYTYDEQGLLLKKDVEGPTGNTNAGFADHNKIYDKSYTYDANGNCTTIINNRETVTYTYDALGRLQTMYEANNNYPREITYTYDNRGNILSQRETTRGLRTGTISWEETSFTYDAYGNCLTEHITADDGYWETTTYTYDQNGRMVAEKYTDEDGYSIVEYTYDQEGRWITVHMRESDGTNDTAACRYDSNGNVASVDVRYSDGVSDTVIFSYDEHGNCIQNSNSNNQRRYTYDDAGNCIRVDTVKPNGEISSSITYNACGKMTDSSNERIVWKLFYYPNGAPTSVQEIDNFPKDHTTKLPPKDYLWTWGRPVSNLPPFA